MTIDPDTGFIQWTPTAGQEGQHTVRVTVEDGQGGFDAQSYVVQIVVEPGNRPPIINSTPVYAATSDRPYQYAVTAADPDGDTVTFSLDRAPAGMDIEPTSGLITWTPSTAQEDDHTITVVATDPDGARGTQSFTVTVAPNQAPTITSTPVENVPAGGIYAYDVWATDPENDPLTFTLDTAPAGMSVDSFGRIRWQPEIDDIASGPHTVEVTVADPYGADASQAFEIQVTADTQAPSVILTANAPQVLRDEEVLFELTATDDVGIEVVTLIVAGQPVPIALVAGRGSAQIAMDQAGTIQAVATATDAAGNEGQSDTLEILVRDPDDTTYPHVEINALVQGDRTITGDELHSTPMVTYLTDVLATIQDNDLWYWRVEYARSDLVSHTHLAAADPDYQLLVEGSGEKTSETVATFDPTLLANDSYLIRVYAVDFNGHVTSRGVLVGVSGDAKLGNFHLEFTDLQLPLAGISDHRHAELRYAQRRHAGRLSATAGT